MKTAVLVTYHWPASGGAGVYRWLKMAKYLPDFGWNVVVLTPANPERPVVDESLLQDVRADQRVLEQRVWEPYGVYRLLSGRRREERVYSGFIREDRSKDTRIVDGLAAWARGNLLIPDPRRFWVRPAVRLLRRELASLQADALITNGPPHSVHLIGLKVAAATGKPWIADFRDPWSRVHFSYKLRLTPPARWLHARLERQVTQRAARVVTVSRIWAGQFEEISGRSVEVIPNGFDPADFPPEAMSDGEPLTIGYFGSMGADRNPAVLWRALAALRRTGATGADRIRVRLYGAVDATVRASAEAYGVADQVELCPYLPHREAVEAMRRTSLLLLVVNRERDAEGAVPGKLYEYFASGRPTLLIGHEHGDAVRILRECGAGWATGYESESEVGAVLRRLLASPWLEPVSDSRIDSYSRRSLAGRYAALLDATVAEEAMRT